MMLQEIPICVALAVVGLLLLWLLQALLEALRPPRLPEFVHRRGVSLVSQEDASQQASAAADSTTATPPGFAGVAWGGLRLPLDCAWTHFLFQGQTGSGKTVLLKVMLDSLLPLVGAGAGFRAVIADPKREMAAIAHTVVPPHVPLWNLNPFDVTGVAWAVGEDVLTPAEADQLAEKLVPEDKNDMNPYFRDNARGCLRGLLIALQYVAPRLWTLRDILLLSRTPEVLTEVLKLCPATRAIALQHFQTEKTGREILSTLGSKLGKYETIAACWDHAPAAVSLRRFLDQEEVLILGYDDSISVPLMALYPLMLKFLQDWVLARNDPSKPVFVVVDEFRLFGKCDLVPLALKGREARACLVICFQDVNGVEALLGEKEARELFGNLLAKCFLAVDTDAAAKFASDSLGKREGYEYTTNVTTSPSGTSNTRSEQIVQRDLVLPDEVRGLPLPTWGRGVVEAFFKSPSTGRFKATVPFRDVIERLRPPADFPSYAQRPAHEQRLRPLTQADVERLNLPMSPAIRATIAGGV